MADMIGTREDWTREEWAAAPCDAAALGAGDWLSLAAAPIFAIMAVVTGVGGSPDMLCSTMHGASLLSGMVPMYLLMSAFHLGPWLNLAAGRRHGACRS
jgi:hypothetical protein